MKGNFMLSVKGDENMISDFRGEEEKPGDPTKSFDAFLLLIPEYFCDEDRKLAGHPAEWSPRLISYSLYLGLAIFALDKELGNKLYEGITPGSRQTSDLVLAGFEVVKITHHTKTGEKWDHAVSFLSTFMFLTSPETFGPTADQELVKQRAPITGFIPALRLSVEDPALANELLRDSVQEQQHCDTQELSERIDWMKRFVAEMMESM